MSIPEITVRATTDARGWPIFVASASDAPDLLSRDSAELALTDGRAYYARFYCVRLGSGELVSGLSDADLRLLTQRAWDASQGDDFRLLRAEASHRGLQVA